MLGDNLRRARQRMDLSQQQVANILGIERSAYTYYETGKNDISAQRLKLLAAIYNVTMDELAADDAWLMQKAQEEEEEDTGIKREPAKLPPEERAVKLNRFERVILAQVRIIESLGRKAELASAVKSICDKGSIPIKDLITDDE